MSDERERLLDVRDLQVHFRRDGKLVKAVDGADLTVRAGECVGLVGESGSGKSVLARSVARLMPDANIEKTSGSVLFDGTDILGLGDRELQQRRRGRFVSMVFQDPLSYLNPTKRVGRQVAEALPRGLPRTEQQIQVGKFFTRVGLPGDVSQLRYPHELSGGMRQRVLIALALASSPRLLIADEPTTALDVTVQIQVLNTLEKLHRERDMALLVITHDLALVAELCDRVYVMYAGQIVESGDVQALFADPKHPYTRGLLASIPDGRRYRADGPPALVGSVPNLSALPSGCRFSPRCPHAFDKCDEMPPLRTLAPTSTSRCWLADPAEAGSLAAQGAR